MFTINHLHPMFVSEVVGLDLLSSLDEAEGRVLIDALMAFAAQDRFIYSHPWAPHDLVLWDNRAVIHRATPFANTTEKRLMVRTTIAGDAPTLAERAA